MKKTLEQAALLAVLLVLAGCAGNEPAEPKWEEHLYRTVVYNSGKNRCVCHGRIQLSDGG